MQTCCWPLSYHWSVNLISLHLPGFAWYGGLGTHWSCYLRYGKCDIFIINSHWDHGNCSPTEDEIFNLIFVCVTIAVLWSYIISEAGTKWSPFCRKYFVNLVISFSLMNNITVFFSFMKLTLRLKQNWDHFVFFFIKFAPRPKQK